MLPNTLAVYSRHTRTRKKEKISKKREKIFRKHSRRPNNKGTPQLKFATESAHTRTSGIDISA